MSQGNKAMNCTDYKNALLAEPGFVDESGHAERCADCQRLREELLALDDKLALALEIPVPELVMPELPELETEQVIDLAARRSRRKPVWYAMAASIALAVLVGIQVNSNRVSTTLAEQVLAHLDHEPAALQVSTTPVSDDRIDRVVPDHYASMNHDSGLITYAMSCTINGKPVPHLVIQGKHGPITVLLMPEETLTEATPLEGTGVKGIILPVGNGSIAIIGDREEQLDEVTESVLDSVTWST